MTNNTTLCAGATLIALTFNDIYLIIVGISILVSTTIAIINAIRSNKTITIDKDVQDKLKDIDDQLNNNKDNESTD